MECISYHDGYKYQLKADYVVDVGIRPDQPVTLLEEPKFLALSVEGTLTIKDGYAWDGPSGPTFDTLNFMRGSLVHDALYQLMRYGRLDPHKVRDTADRLLQKMCREDGMSRPRAWFVYRGVSAGGRLSADPASKRPLTKAPKGCR